MQQFSIHTTGECREFLIQYLADRKRKNALYSLRTLAKQLQISPAQLSQFMSGKRPLTLKVALKIAEKFEFTSLERQQILNAVSAPESDLQDSDDPKSLRVSNVRILPEEEFQLVSDWYYFAILSLGHLKTNKASAGWIAKRLGIDLHTARMAFERLKKLGHIEENKGQFRQSSKPLHTTRDIPSTSLRQHHHQHLELAQQKLDEIEISQREYATMTIATNPLKLKKAKEMMHHFKNELCQFLGSGEKTEVYTLALQLFPLTTLTTMKDSKEGSL